MTTATRHGNELYDAGRRVTVPEADPFGGGPENWSLPGQADAQGITPADLELEWDLVLIEDAGDDE